MCADEVEKFKAEGKADVGSKPRFILYRNRQEVGRMEGANGNELARLVAKNCGAKKEA